MKISVMQYAKSLHETTAGKNQQEVDGVVANFFKVLVKNRQQKMFGKIIAKFSEIYNSENGIVEAEVTTSRKLDQPMVKKIKEFIQRKYNAKEVILSAKGGSASGGNNIVDEKIKGGVIIKVGDEIMDGSVSRQLNELKKILTK